MWMWKSSWMDAMGFVVIWVRLSWILFAAVKETKQSQRTEWKTRIKIFWHARLGNVPLVPCRCLTHFTALLPKLQMVGMRVRDGRLYFLCSFWGLSFFVFGHYQLMWWWIYHFLPRCRYLFLLNVRFSPHHDSFYLLKCILFNDVINFEASQDRCHK